MSGDNATQGGLPVIGTEASDFTGRQWAVPLEVTRPDAYRSHELSDGELVMVATARRGRLDEFTWAAITGLTGATPGAVRALHDGYVATGPGLSIFGLLEVAMALIFLTLLVTAIIQPRNRGKPAMEIVDEIKARRHDTLTVVQGAAIDVISTLQSPFRKCRRSPGYCIGIGTRQQTPHIVGTWDNAISFARRATTLRFRQEEHRCLVCWP
jgi:hypothetical protein